MGTITRDSLKQILASKPEGVSDEMVVRNLLDRGENIQGLTLPSQIRAEVEAEKTRQESVVGSRRDSLADIGQETAGTISDAIQGEGEFEGAGVFNRGVSATAAGFSTVPKAALALAPEAVQTGVEKAGEVIGKGFSWLTDTDRMVESKVPGVARFGNMLQDIARLEAEGHISPGSGEKAQQQLYAVEEDLKTLSAGGEIAGTIAGAKGLETGLAKTGALTNKAFQATLKNIKPGKAPTVENVTPETLRTTAKLGDSAEYKKAVDAMADAYKGSLIGNKAAKLKLEELARETGRTTDDILKDFVDARGLAGKIDDSGRVSFDDAIRDFNTRQTALAEAIDTSMSNRIEITPVSRVRQQVSSAINERGTILNRGKVVREADRLMDDLEAQYPNGIPAQDLNRIRIQANTKFKDQFEVDANKAIGDAMRSRIDGLDPKLTQANANWGRLEDMKKIASLMDGRKVDAGLLADSLGSYMGAMLIGTTGLAAGSGSLVIAGLASTLGMKTIANAMRRHILNKPKNQALLDAVRQDEALVNEILKGVDDANKAQLERLFLPEPTQINVGPKTPNESSVVAVPAKTGFPRQNPETGRMERTYTTESVITPEQGKSLQQLGERLNESSTNDIPNYLKNNKQAGYFRIPVDGKISSTVTPKKVAGLLDDQTFESIAIILDDLPTARTNPNVNRFLQDMKLDKASNDELLSFLREVTNEYENLRNIN